MNPFISVVIPVYNEEANIDSLLERLLQSMGLIGKPFELIFTNDGSTDESLDKLKLFFEKHPDLIRIVDLNGNFGQHIAIIAGFKVARGEIIVTLDADLQNPPEEIHKLIQKMEQGHDYVGSYREKRQDNFFRTYGSLAMNWMRIKFTNVRMKDHGCMLRAYSRKIVQQIVNGRHTVAYVPTLAYKLSKNPIEIPVKHASRAAGESKYTLRSLVKLSFDLMTEVTISPFQFFTILGLVSSGLSFLMLCTLTLKSVFLGTEFQTNMILCSVLFFLLSLIILGLGLLGEYMSRLSITLKPRLSYDVLHVYGLQNDS